MYKVLAAGAASLLVLAGCGTLRDDVSKGPVAQLFFPDKDPVTPASALERYYDTIPDSALPVAPAGPALPAADTVLTRILVASCNDEEKPSPALAHLATEAADLLLMLGDNVYGDKDGPAYINNDADLVELRASFTELASRPEFQAARAAHPMMVAWDDHDFGANDAGRDFPFKRFAERIHEHFWGLDKEKDVGNWDGTYYARSFGPAGQRVQIIMLDTRFFRSDLTGTDEWGAPGKERYIPSSSPSQDMLGNAQWTWLQNQLAKPADIRLVVSSIQVLPTAHGYEAWATLPAERARLFEMIETSGAKGVVFLSGDRHTSFMYRDEDPLTQTAVELTASSLNVSFAETSPEKDARQMGAGFAPENFGEVAIDWQGRVLAMKLRDNAGNLMRERTVSFDDLGL